MIRGRNQISGNSNATPEKLTIPSSFVLKLTQIAAAAADVLPSETASDMIQADAHLHLCRNNLTHFLFLAKKRFPPARSVFGPTATLSNSAVVVRMWHLACFLLNTEKFWMEFCVTTDKPEWFNYFQPSFLEGGNETDTPKTWRDI